MIDLEISEDLLYLIIIYIIVRRRIKSIRKSNDDLIVINLSLLTRFFNKRD